MHTAPFTNYTAHGTLQTANCTLCTAGVLWLAVHALSRQYIGKVIEHVWYNDPLYTLRAADCTLHTSMAHCTLHTAHYTLPWHTALYKVHAALWWARDIWQKLTYASIIPLLLLGILVKKMQKKAHPSPKTSKTTIGIKKSSFQQKQLFTWAYKDVLSSKNFHWFSLFWSKFIFYIFAITVK